MFKYTTIFAAIAGLVFALAPAAQAVIIAVDSMEYTPADPVTAEGGSGWVSGDAWGSKAVAGGLTYTNLQTVGSANLQATGDGDPEPERAIDTTGGSLAATAGVVDGSGNIGLTGTTVWFSMLAQVPSGTGYPEMRLARDGADINVITLRSDNGAANWSFFNDKDNTGVVRTELVFAVFSIDFGATGDIMTGWLNPDAGVASPTGEDFTSGYSQTGNDLSFDGFALRSPTSTVFHIDEIRVGTTFADVAPLPEPATLALLGIGGLGLLLRRKRR